MEDPYETDLNDRNSHCPWTVNYTAAQLKQSQGTISQNALLEAGDKVAEAREKVAKAENDLFSAWNTYRWAVDCGIMN